MAMLDHLIVPSRDGKASTLLSLTQDNNATDKAGNIPKRTGSDAYEFERVVGRLNQDRQPGAIKRRSASAPRGFTE